MRELLSTVLSNTGAALNQVLVAGSAVAADEVVVIWAAEGSFATSFFFEDTVGVKQYPTRLAAVDTSSILMPYDGLPYNIGPLGLGVRYDAGGSAGVKLDYTIERSPFMTAVGKRELLFADFASVVDVADDEIIAAPPAGKKIVIWRVHGS